MTSHKPVFSIRTLTWAVQGALLTMVQLPGAFAADAAPAAVNPEVTELTAHSSSIELGMGYVGSGSYKAGEYNGLQKEGAYAIGHIDLRGGGSYDSDDATRWRIGAGDLGLDTRDLSAEYGKQGSFRIRLGYDEILRNRSDSYQTPYLGTGTNSLSLPGSWIIPVVPRISATTPNARGLLLDVAQSPTLVAGLPVAPTPAQLATSNALIAADAPSFHHVDLATKRKRSDIGLQVSIDPRWEVKLGFRHEDKNGLKPMGMASRQTGGDITAVMPDLIDQSTEQVDVGVSYTGEHSFMQVGYYGSFFTNYVDSMSWQNWGKLTTPNINTMSSAPNNDFHQLNLTGGYDFSRNTRLVIDAALGRSTQNDSFLTNATTPVVPVTSANALVDSKTLSLKLTGRPISNLQLAAVYKYDARENQTAVNTYQFSDNNQAVAPLAPMPGLLAQNANANQPFSKRVNKLGFDADYRLTKGQSVKAGFDFQSTDRWCEGTWVSCVEAATTDDKTLRFEYRNSVLENLSGRVGYEHGSRTISNYNENAVLSLVPFANVSPTGAPGGATAYGTLLANGLTLWGPNAGISPVTTNPALAFFFPNNNALEQKFYGNENRIAEPPGMRQYNMADRDQDKLKAAMNWQASEALALQGGVKLTRDNYGNSVYGLKEVNGWSMNFDASYQASDSLSFSAFYTYEDQHTKSAGSTYVANSTATNVAGFTAISGGCYPDLATRNLNNKIDPCNNWTADLHDQVDTLGMAFNAKGLMAGKLQVNGDISLTRAVTNADFTGGNYVNNPLAVTGAPTGTVAAFYIPATALPTVTTKTFDLRLVADYALNKKSSVRLGYLYRHMQSQDWAYEGLQPGGLTQLVPTYEQSPNYSVHALALSYIMRFN